MRVCAVLQEKRSLFPRFYFIGDDDLLEILGQSTNPAVIQTHLKKLFAGIHSVEFSQGNKHIVAMKSLDGEVVPLRKNIQIVPEVEVSQPVTRRSLWWIQPSRSHTERMFMCMYMRQCYLSPWWLLCLFVDVAESAGGRDEEHAGRAAA